MALQRLQKDLVKIRRNPPALCTAAPVDDDLYHWEATIQGPKNTPYEGGLFKLDIKFNHNYPYGHPDLHFKHPFYHLNVSKFTNKLCIDLTKIVESGPNFTINNVLVTAIAVLNAPNPDSALNDEAAKFYKINCAAYTVKTVEWTKLYAT